MATPIGHALVAGMITMTSDNQRPRQWSWRLAVFGTFLALAPDLDMVPDTLLGTSFHHGITHSLAFGVVVSLAASLSVKGIVRWFPHISYIRLWAMGLLFYVSHLAVDFFTLDNGAPFGMPLVWPFIGSYIDSPIYLIPNVAHQEGILVTHNINVVMRELLVFGVPALYLVLSSFGKLRFAGRYTPLLFITILASVLALSARSNPFF